MLARMAIVMQLVFFFFSLTVALIAGVAVAMTIIIIIGLTGIIILCVR